jgi:hypothetical protein
MLRFSTYKLAKKIIPSPPSYENPSLEALKQKGEEFEKGLYKPTKGSRKKLLLK